LTSHLSCEKAKGFIGIPAELLSYLLKSEDFIQMKVGLHILRLLSQKKAFSLDELDEEVNKTCDRERVASEVEGLVQEGILRKEGEYFILPEANIFSLYEENIGMLTPILAEKLKEAEKVYPYSWIEEAFGEAIAHGARKWSYIQAILERWKRDGKVVRGTKKADPDKYIRGKYGYLVRR
jgi:DnaD/phage-associated family protein